MTLQTLNEIRTALLWSKAITDEDVSHIESVLDDAGYELFGGEFAPKHGRGEDGILYRDKAEPWDEEKEEQQRKYFKLRLKQKKLEQAIDEFDSVSWE